MKVSLNTVARYVDFELPAVEELVGKINAQLGGVEEVIDLREKYAGPIVAKVVECNPHPDSDHMHVCKIDDGGATPDVERDENGYVQVVCGAPNVREGLMVAWLPPGSTVPVSFDETERFVLGSRNLRGVMSHGMLASPRELALGDDHDGILEIDETEWKPTEVVVRPGAKFAAIYGLDDVIIDIENKMFTHRPDLFGQLGVAREIAGIFGQEFHSPDWYKNVPEFSDASGLELDVFNDCPGKVPRIMFTAIKNIEVKPSPLWLRAELVRLGGKPINNIVDVTNYVMLLTAQPTHAYDYDKLRGHRIGVRMAQAGETLPLLNGKTYQLTVEDIVIADGEGAIGLGGVMGGGNSEVSADTTSVVLEVATFDMYAVRKSSMRHGVFTDALTRFNKGQSPLQNDHVMRLLVQSIQDVSSGQPASKVYDLRQNGIERYIEAQEAADPLTIQPQFIRERLGVDLPKRDMVRLLGNVEFPLCEDCGWDQQDTVDNDDDLHVSVPFWRTDIHEPEDVVEEIGRLYGFDNLPQELPARSISPAPKNAHFEMRRKIGQILSGAGANEVKTYSFVHERVLKNAGQNIDQAFRLSNALSPDLQYYRLSLTPSLLDKINMNIKAGHDEFALYEFGKAHNKLEHDFAEPSLPKEAAALSFVYAAKKPGQSAPYYVAKRYLEQLLATSGLQDDLVYEPLENADLYDNPWLQQMTAPFDPKRSAVLRAMGSKLATTKGLVWGVVGEFKPGVTRAYKLPETCAGFELDPSLFLEAQNARYRPLSRFPYVTQDISLKVQSDVSYVAVYQAAQRALRAEQSELLRLELLPLGIYRPDDSETKTITLRLIASNYQRTLTDAEVGNYLDKVAATVGTQLGGVRV
jgi:phenylalanyl-tRNA synthetase beta chain